MARIKWCLFFNSAHAYKGMADDDGAAVVKAKQAQVDKLARQLSALTTQESHLRMQLELVRARRMGFTWAVTVALSVLLMFHAYANGSLLLTCANAYVFLANWRALYVASSASAAYVYAATWAVAAFTLKAV